MPAGLWLAAAPFPPLPLPPNCVQQVSNWCMMVGTPHLDRYTVRSGLRQLSRWLIQARHCGGCTALSHRQWWLASAAAEYDALLPTTKCAAETPRHLWFGIFPCRQDKTRRQAAKTIIQPSSDVISSRSQCADIVSSGRCRRGYFYGSQSDRCSC